MQDRPGPFTLREGAAALGISLNTLRRRIAAGEIKAEKIERPQGFVWQVYLDGSTAPFKDGANGTVHQDGAGTVQAERSPGPAIAQAETIGQLRAENAALVASTATQTPRTTGESRSHASCALQACTAGSSSPSPSWRR